MKINLPDESGAIQPVVLHAPVHLRILPRQSRPSEKSQIRQSFMNSETEWEINGAYGARAACMRCMSLASIGKATVFSCTQAPTMTLEKSDGSAALVLVATERQRRLRWARPPCSTISEVGQICRATCLRPRHGHGMATAWPSATLSRRSVACRRLPKLESRTQFNPAFARKSSIQP